MENTFIEIGVVIIAASLLGVLGYFLRQPLILAFIGAGMILGPSGTNILSDVHFIESISHIGVMLMLFLIGLEMSTAKLKDLGLVALVVGIGQVLFTGLGTYALAHLLGFYGIAAAYIAIALTLSSTVVTVKLLLEKRDINSFYGQITIGVLIVQDIIAILALLALGGFTTGGFDPMTAVNLFVGGTLLAVTTMMFAKYFLSHLYNKIAGSQELLILFSLSWCFIIAILGKELGLSMEIGAFIAGINLANLPYTFEINAKAKLLRDFFITIFFVALGASLSFASIDFSWVPLVVFSLFILVGNPLIVMTLMGILGYDKRNSLFTGLTIANVSEFSLILVAMGATLGHVNDSTVTLITLITIITMVISSYMITYNGQLYKVLKRPLSIFEFRAKKKKKESPTKGMRNHIILLGYGDTGRQILKQIQTFKDHYVVVDHDNAVIKELINENIPCAFGDVEDEELLDDLGLDFTEIIISTLPNEEDNYYIFKKLKELPASKRPIFIAVAETGRSGLDLFVNGADYVIVKSFLGANQVFALNKELYGLPDDLLLKVGEGMVGPKNPLKEKFAKDIDYATFLDNLNAIRLKELQGRFKDSKQVKSKHQVKHKKKPITRAKKTTKKTTKK